MKPELSLHLATADLLRRVIGSGMLWTHFPAGEKRDARTGAKLKAMGLSAGWPDFIIIIPGGKAAFIELKASKGRLSQSQTAFREQAEANGCHYALCRSLDDVVAALRCWRSGFAP